MAITEAKLRELRQLSPREQVDNDIFSFLAFIQNPGDRSVGEFLKRLFLTVRYGGLLFRENAGQSQGLSGWQWWHYTNLPIASVFGHGGRLMIQYKNIAFRDWLFGNVKNLISKRFSTHEMAILHQDVQLPNGLPKTIQEIKSGITHISGGLNAACWGAGRTNPHSNNNVRRDGCHGHFCIIRDKIKKGYSGILIGLEGSQAGKNDQYGGSHDASGKSGEFSPTGSQKWRHLQMGPGCRYDDDTFYNPESPRTKIKKKIIGKNKIKEKPPPVADTLLIVIPDSWRQADFTADAWDNRFLGLTTQPPPHLQNADDTPEEQEIRERYRMLLAIDDRDGSIVADHRGRRDFFQHNPSGECKCFRCQRSGSVGARSSTFDEIPRSRTGLRPTSLSPKTPRPAVGAREAPERKRPGLFPKRDDRRRVFQPLRPAEMARQIATDRNLEKAFTGAFLELNLIKTDQELEQLDWSDIMASQLCDLEEKIDTAQRKRLVSELNRLKGAQIREVYMRILQDRDRRWR